jgi:hypothetical protein
MALFLPQNRAGFCAAYAPRADTEVPQRDLVPAAPPRPVWRRASGGERLNEQRPLAALHRQHHLPTIREGAMTRSTALVSSSPALTYRPSAHTYTTFRSSNRRCFHASYASCQLVLSRLSEAADHGAAECGDNMNRAPSHPTQKQSTR